MCGIAGIVSKEDRDLGPLIKEMLEVLRHRGPDGAGIVIGEHCERKQSLTEIDFHRRWGKFALGHVRLAITGEASGIQPFQSSDRRLALLHNGEIYNHHEIKSDRLTGEATHTRSDSEVLVRYIEQEYTGDLEEALERVLPHLDGVYALAVKDSDTVVLARDRVGVRQLYYYAHGPVVAFASEKKPLVALGGDAITIHRLPPGHMLIIEPDGYRLRRYWHPESLKSDWLIKERHEALRRYDQALTESIRKRVHDRDRVGIIYSGGVDSFLIAHLVKELGVPFTCYTAGRDEGASDIEWARSTAKDHGFPLKVQSLSVEDIEEMIPEVIATIEDHSLNQVEVAVPIFASIRMAQEAGERVILTGQGADELFGGYPWYPAVVDQEGYDAFVDRSWEDTFLLYKECLEREDKIAMAHSLELRVPYLDPEVIRVAFEISPELKIARNGDNVQKRIHRAYCLALDLPTDIAMRSKEAAQHGANVHDVFEQLAEQRGYSAGLLDRVEYDPARSVTEKLGSSSRYGYRYGREDLWKPLPHVQFYLDTLAAEQGVLPRASRFHFETTQMKLASLEVH